MTERNKANHSNQVEFELDPVVLLALLGTIVLDTINMDKGANCGTPRDQCVLDQLIELFLTMTILVPFFLETPQLHEKKLLLVHDDNIHYYDSIHKSNGKH
jgi:hypothetical protein